MKSSECTFSCSDESVSSVTSLPRCAPGSSTRRLGFADRDTPAMAPRGLVRDFTDVVSKVAADYAKDRRLCWTLAVGATSLALFTHHQTSRPDIAAQFRVASAECLGRAQARKKGASGSGKPAHTEGALERDSPDDTTRSLDLGSTKTKSSETSVAAVAFVSPAVKPGATPRRKAAAVDTVFLQRIVFILKIVIPSLTSKEAALLAIQTTMLVARSLLSLRIAKKGGDGLRAVMERSWSKFGYVLGDFCVSGLAASFVNSSLKYMTNSVTSSFRERLTEKVHREYLTGGAYYKAAVLRVGNLDNADQRIADDLHQFCYTLSDLFARTFKPLLDVVLSTHRMGENMGYRGLLILYAYFLTSGLVIKRISPPFAEYIAKTQRLEGDFRRTHSRLITHAEEVAFLDGARREEQILNSRLQKVTSWTRFYHYLQWKQGVVDQWLVKYLASMIGWPVLAFPFLADKTNRPIAELAALYRESDTLIQSASSSIGDLMMVYKKLQRLSGFTARVVELLEAVEADGKSANSSSSVPVPAGNDASPRESERVSISQTPGTSSERDSFSFHNLTIHSPDGRLLVKNMSLTLGDGENLFVSGANGSGKTSLFRVLAGLWRPTSGGVTRPDGRFEDHGHGNHSKSPPFTKVFYVPQKPYLSHGTLRDQVLYPDSYEDMLNEELIHESNAGKSREEIRRTIDKNVMQALRTVNLAKLVQSQPLGLDVTKHDWADVLSGGEKQRVGLARVFFRKPPFAVLDEATSAVNPDEEALFYETLRAMNIKTFSIAHRPELEKFHDVKLTLHADGTGGWSVAKLGRGR